MNYLKSLLSAGAVILLLTGSAIAQELSTGVDVVSKYVWRGAEAGSGSPSLQPSVEYSLGGFQFGFWGATPLANAAGTTEIDIYTGYTFTMQSGASLGFMITDYTYPSSGVRLGNFNNYDDADGAGAHQLEAGLSFTGSESFPVSFMVSAFVYNLENNPVYFEAGYSTKLKETDLKIFAGATTGDKKLYYGAESFGFVNIGFTATKTVKVTESFSFPVFSTVSINPATEKMFYVLGISL